MKVSASSFQHPAGRRRPDDAIDVGGVVRAQQVGLLHQRRVEGGEIEVGVLQGVDHRAKPLGPLRMTFARTVVEHVLMGVERDGHVSS
ncbi:hypothetical protein [Phenylobacterium kunshanense]|uniref:hypothetical protein n=1 Tax=Phenylobacterium kunshanense TaxID=1445034 RepID=UPI001F0CA6B2|nr:hypothetical protein [Phenylobacterium kunshanense]